MDVGDRAPERWLLTTRPLPPRFRRRVVTIAPGEHRAYDPEAWRDALLVVERGQIELEGGSGARYRFERGHILWLVDLPLRALHNHGPEPVVLVSVSRRPRP